MPAGRPITRGWENIAVFHEGPKKAYYMAALGIPSYSLFGGANVKISEYNFTQIKEDVVWIWPDNDDAGDEFASRVYNELGRIGKRPFLVPIDGMGLPLKGDFIDYIHSFKRKYNVTRLKDLANGVERFLETLPFHPATREERETLEAERIQNISAMEAHR